MNFYTDNESLSFYLHHPEMAEIANSIAQAIDPV